MKTYKQLISEDVESGNGFIPNKPLSIVYIKHFRLLSGISSSLAKTQVEKDMTVMTDDQLQQLLDAPRINVLMRHKIQMFLSGKWDRKGIKEATEDEKIYNIWGKDRITGYWKFIRDSLRDNVPEWLAIVSSDEENKKKYSEFKVSKYKPKS